ncbi:MAG: phage tail length tape measure family protein [Gemmobacter sp.]|nr:phage tail length tape measure family protein [Gemmobacter sp.]
MELSLLLRAEVAAAQAAIRQTVAEVKAIGTANRQTGADTASAAQGQIGSHRAVADTARRTRAEVAAIGTAARQAGAEAMRSGREQATAFRTAATAAREAATAARQQAAAVAAAARDATAAANRGAGATGNLVAQFNDIGVMLAAGQNPLQLAIQQGTQISQVLGPMGAAGAVKALGTAFLSAINPFNFAILATIAGMGALVNWITSAGDRVPPLADAVDGLSTQVDAYAKASERARASTADLRAEFGQSANAARTYLREMAELERRRAEDAAATAFRSVQDDLQINAKRPDIGDQGRLADLFDQSLYGKGRTSRQKLINNVLSGLAQVDQAGAMEDGEARLDAMADAARLLRDRFREAAEASGGRSTEEDRVLRLLTEQVLQLERLRELRNGDRAQQLAELDPGIRESRARAPQDSADDTQVKRETADLQRQSELAALITRHGRESAEVANFRREGERQVLEQMLAQLPVAGHLKTALRDAWDAANPVRNPQAERINDSLRHAQALKQAGAAAKAEADKMLASLKEESALRALIARYGQNSVEVAQARSAAERAAYAEVVKSVDVSDDLKAALMEAWDAAKGLGRADMAGGIAAARAEARGMADEIMRALGAAQSLASQAISGLRESELRVKHAKDPVALAGALGRDRMIATQGVRRQGAEGVELAALDAEVNAYARNLEQIERNNLARQAALSKPSRGGSSRPEAGSLAALRKESTEALAALDMALAGVNEKVRAGLISTAEGTEAVASAKRSAADQLADLIPQIDKVGPAAAGMADRMRNALKDLAAQVGKTGSELSKSLSGSFESSFAAFVSGAMDGKDAMADFGKFVLSEIAKIAAGRFTASFVTPLIDSVLGMFKMAQGGIVANGIKTFAQGGIVSNGVKAFAQGGIPALGAHSDSIVDRPTAFAMQGATGLMGEAGAEAILPLRTAPGGGMGVLATGPGGQSGILPLRRTAGGSLGVQVPDWRPALLDRPDFAFAKGGVVAGGGSLFGEAASGQTAPPGYQSGAGPAAPSAPPVVVNITNTAPGVQARQSERQEGGRSIIDVLIEQVEGAMTSNLMRGVGPLNDALTGTFGLGRTGR